MVFQMLFCSRHILDFYLKWKIYSLCNNCDYTVMLLVLEISQNISNMSNPLQFLLVDLSLFQEIQVDSFLWRITVQRPITFLPSYNLCPILIINPFVRKEIHPNKHKRVIEFMSTD